MPFDVCLFFLVLSGSQKSIEISVLILNMCKYIPHERKSIIRKLQNKII